ncbi:hypothetical protein Megpolyxen_01400 [Candidatus Megaera polyxenophila]|nr:hypothetical protein Megpolyxen_01400 [Candidatus Megaera polyxenophila]
MFFIAYFKEILLAIGAFIAVYLFRKNKTLTLENKGLTENNLEKDKVINIQQKVLDVSESIKLTDLDTNLERLSDKTK